MGHNFNGAMMLVFTDNYCTQGQKSHVHLLL